MIRIGIFSDLHLEHREVWEINILLMKIKEAEKKCDYLLNAGDLSPSLYMRNLFNHHLNLKLPSMTVMGNHDYYENTPNISACALVDTFGEYKIAGTTLWTDFNKGNEFVKKNYKTCLYDAKCIISPSGDLGSEVAELNDHNFKFIQKADADIVMSHHCPSMLSVHPKYRQNKSWDFVNYYFASDYDDYILNSKIKLWVHGHTHIPFDYMLGNCRIVCNPLGYVSERKVEDYEIKYVEVE